MKKYKRQNSPKSIHHILQIVAGGLALLWLAGMLFFQVFAWLHPAKVMQSQGKKEVTQGLQQVLDSLNPPGIQVLARIVDDGCSEAELFGDLGCSLTAEKYFLSNDDVAEDANLARLGTDELLSKVTLRAFTGDALPPQTVEIYSKDQKTTSPHLADLIHGGVIKSPQNEDFIYGVRITVKYYSCHQDSLFGEVCRKPR